MRLWKRAAVDPPATDGQDGTPSPSPETARALRAVQRAAADLAEAQRVRRKIERLGDAIEQETSRNGFRIIIEQALGGKA